MSDMTVSPTVRNGRFAGLFSNLADRIARYKLYRRTLEELYSLDSRELADLGMNRSMLRSVAYKTAYDA
ncbi:MAG: DUF1127 domain-containing protein [Silicimonas sp.]|nr:DUF1127 domain-containing protein [Silicimonas sp.]